jgi:predicted ArsR family transcriptional regulator
VHPVEDEDEQKHERDARYLAALDRLGTATVADLGREVEATPKQVLYHVNRFVARGAVVHVGGRGGIGDPRRYAVRKGS